MSFGFSEKEARCILYLFSNGSLADYLQYTKEDFIEEIRHKCQENTSLTHFRYNATSSEAIMNIIEKIMNNEKTFNTENAKKRQELELLGLSKREINCLLFQLNASQNRDLILLKCKVALLRMGFSKSESCYLLNSMYETLLETYSNGSKEAFIDDIRKKSINYPEYTTTVGLMDPQIIVEKVRTIMTRKQPKKEINSHDIHSVLSDYGFSEEEISWLLCLRPNELEAISSLTIHEILLFIQKRGVVYLSQDEKVSAGEILKVITKAIDEYESNKSSDFLARDNRARNMLSKQKIRNRRISGIAFVIVFVCICIVIGALLENARPQSAGGVAVFLYIFFIAIIISALYGNSN